MNLAQWQKHFPEGRVPFEQALSVVRQLVDVFHRAHVEQCEHGDVSSSSIQVEQNEDGTLAVRLDGADEAGPGGVPGVRRYQAPECWWGAHQSTYTDQYALAALFVELVTGKVPFAEIFATDDDSVIRTAVCNHPPKLPEDCPRREVLLRALSKDPRLRFRSCGDFLSSLTHAHIRRGHGTHGHHSEAHHSESHRGRRPAQRRNGARTFRRFLLALLVLGCFSVWFVKSGWYDQALRVIREEAAKPAEAAVASAVAPTSAVAVAESPEPSRLAQVEEEVRKQKAVSDQALRDLQEFLEKGGSLLAEMRRDSLRQDLQRLQTEKTAMQSENTAAERLEEALAQLRSRAVPYEAVSAAIPGDSEVALAYKALGEAAKRMDELSARFTERHPDVTRQKQELEAAARRYATSVGAAYRRVQDDRAAKTRRFAETVQRSEDLVAEIAKLEREIQVARLKQTELEQAREREAQRLAELRRMETRVRFGGEPLPAETNAAARPPASR